MSILNDIWNRIARKPDRRKAAVTETSGTKNRVYGGYGRGRDTVFRHPQGYEGTEQLSATSGRRLLQRDQSTRNFADI